MGEGDGILITRLKVERILVGQRLQLATSAACFRKNTSYPNSRMSVTETDSG